MLFNSLHFVPALRRLWPVVEKMRPCSGNSLEVQVWSVSVALEVRPICPLDTSVMVVKCPVIPTNGISVDDLAEDKRKLIRFWRRKVNFKVTARSNIWVSYCSGRRHILQRWNRASGSRVTGPGRVGSRVNASNSVFDPVLSFNMRVYRGVLSTCTE